MEVCRLGVAQIELVGDVDEKSGEHASPVVVLELNDRAGSVCSNALNIGDIDPVGEIVPGRIDGTVDAELHVESEILVSSRVCSAVDLQFDSHSACGISEDDALGGIEGNRGN